MAWPYSCCMTVRNSFSRQPAVPADSYHGSTNVLMRIKVRIDICPAGEPGYLIAINGANCHPPFKWGRSRGRGCLHGTHPQSHWQPKGSPPRPSRGTSARRTGRSQSLSKAVVLASVVQNVRMVSVSRCCGENQEQDGEDRSDPKPSETPSIGHGTRPTVVGVDSVGGAGARSLGAAAAAFRAPSGSL